MSDGVFGGVRDGEVRGGRAGLFVDFTDFAVKDEDGRAAFKCGDLYVLPRDAARPACLEGFEGCFFSGEARGVVLCGDGSARVAVSALSFCENARGETRRARQHFTHAANFCNVYADGNYH